MDAKKRKEEENGGSGEVEVVVAVAAKDVGKISFAAQALRVGAWVGYHHRVPQVTLLPLRQVGGRCHYNGQEHCRPWS